MGIGIILTYIMTILGNRLMRSKVFQPLIEIMMKPRFIVINKDRSSDMHSVDKDQSFSDTALFEAFFYFWSDIDEGPPCRHLKPQFFSIALHNFLLKVSLLPANQVEFFIYV
jgi:hypothetical protein